MSLIPMKSNDYYNNYNIIIYPSLSLLPPHSAAARDPGGQQVSSRERAGTSERNDSSTNETLLPSVSPPTGQWQQQQQ